MTVTPAQITEFQETILGNYQTNGRALPWRQTSDPYEILVSEIMLQQTQTERTIGKYAEWLAAFPDMQTLAAAPLSLVLARWNGLGYNRRARFLQETCKIIVKERDGAFPQSAEELDALPGIGPYTARAVMTFAFGKSEVFIETNIRSVFLFFFFRDRLEEAAESSSGQKPVHDAEILPLIAQTVHAANPRIWYYALMDYGAALKKAVVNPNRKSAHYARQSRFDGSLRQARGAIIRCLAKQSAPAASLYEIARQEDIDLGRLEKAAAALVAEGLIAKAGDLYAIGE
ncbi:MAG: A/G-specific adenine glycosylase [Treponema sp.]|jgi:A/G-specific adenine glycosylase|nr:A/G-specific adenine glycosylase [Treponema sp.]